MLTSAKTPQFCHSQHRNLPRLRRHMPHPQVELHPETAKARGIGEGDWVRIETPHGRLRARARLKASIDARVVAAQHGWWQACPELGLPGYEALGPESANYNAAINADAVDPISGAPGHRSFLCEVSKA